MTINAIKYIKSKRISYLVIVFIGIILLSISIINSSYNSMIYSIFDEITDRFGKFHAVVFDVDDSIIEAYRNSKSVAEIGVTENYGVYNISGYELILGYIDDSCRELFSINLVDGQWPANDKEIVLESYYTDLIDNLGVGSRLQLTDKTGKIREYTVSGFMSSYTADVNGSKYHIKEINGYPNAVVLDSNFDNIHKNLAVYAKGAVHSYDSPDSALISMSSEYTQGKCEMSFNDSVYTEFKMNYIDSLLTHKMRDEGIIYVLIGIFLLLFYHSYYRSYKDISVTLYKLGSSKIYIITVFMTICILLFMSGIFFAFTLAIATKLIFSIDIHMDATSVLICFIANAACGIVQIFSYRLNNDTFYFTGIQELPKNRKTKIRISSISEANIKNNILKIIAVIAAIVILINTMFTYDYENIKKRQLFRLDEKPWLIAGVNRATITNQIGDFHVFPDIKHYDEELVNSIYSVPGVDSVGKGYQCFANLIITDKKSNYLNYMRSENFYGYDTGMITHESNLYDIKGIQSIHVIVVDEHNIGKYSEFNKELNNDIMQENTCVVYFPDISDKTFVENDIKSVYHNGENLTLGTLRLKENETDIYSAESFEYFECDFYIKNAVYDGFKYRDESNGEIVEEEGIVILVSVETFNNSSVFDGISDFTVYPSEDITENEYIELKKAFNRIVKTVPDSEAIDFFERNDLHNNIERIMGNSLKIIGITTVIIILLFTFIVTNESIYRNRKEFGILRSIGMTKGRMFRYLLDEYLTYTVLFIALAVPITLFYCRFYGTSVLGIYLNSGDYINVAMYLLVAMIVFFIVMCLCGVINVIRYYRSSISKMIAFNE